MITLPFFLLLAVVLTPVDAGRCSTMARDTLLGCFSNHIDANHDGRITRDEIPSFTKPWFFDMCDLDHDGALTEADWNAENACCRDHECIYKVKISFWTTTRLYHLDIGGARYFATAF